MISILLVDDNEASRKLLERRLKRRGYDVIIAVDGAQAIDLATTRRPGVILMDMNLPVKDGWTATREIREQAAMSNTPIIALTNHDGETQIRRCLEAGCDAVESKGIPFAQLADIIERYASRGAG